MCRITIFSTAQPDTYKSLPIDLVLSAVAANSAHQNRDGFGLYHSDTNALWKTAHPATTAFRQDEFWKWLDEHPYEGGQIIAHVRQATVGRNSFDSKLSHPFLIGDHLVGVHNGSFSNWRDVAAKHNYTPDQAKLDSEVFLRVLYDNILTNGGLGFDDDAAVANALDVIQKTVDEFIGPFVVVFTLEPGTIWIITGQNRTLHAYLHPDLDMVLLNTDSFLSDDFNFEWRKLVAAGVMPNYRELRATKLPDDSVFLLRGSDLNLIGDIKSVAEAPKKAVAPVVQTVTGANAKASTVQGTVTTQTAQTSSCTGFREYGLPVRVIRRGLSKRLIFLDGTLGLSELAVTALLSSLYPLISDSCIFSQTETTLEILKGFIEGLSVDSGVVLDELELKDDFWQKMLDVYDQRYNRTLSEVLVLNDKFVEPYWVNSVAVLQDIYDKMCIKTEVKNDQLPNNS